MFHRMFGRRRSPVEGEPNADSGTEATEGQADIVNSDDFVLLGEMLFFSLFFFPPFSFFGMYFLFFHCSISSSPTSFSSPLHVILCCGLYAFMLQQKPAKAIVRKNRARTSSFTR